MQRPRILKMSSLYAPTLKEDPGDAELASHKLLLRAAMMRKVAAGVYSFLPLGFKVLRKVEQIVREEMDAIGCQEMVMSIIQPGELWKESGRWDDYGAELFRLSDRHEHVFALSPTQEELITSIVRGELRSYRQLPLSLYHIQWKYRDEVRPRFGLLRAREFVMKDAYSFHTSRESLQEHYDLQAAAYGRICERMGLRYVPVEADSGQIGGKVTKEFMALADSGEAEVVHCGCGYAANVEVACARVAVATYGEKSEGDGARCGDDAGAAAGDAGSDDAGAAGDTGSDAAGAAGDAGASGAGLPELTEISTPGVSSIADLAAYLHIGEDATVKALAVRGADGQVYLLFIPGNHELGEIKAQKALAALASAAGGGAAAGAAGAVSASTSAGAEGAVAQKDAAPTPAGAEGAVAQKDAAPTPTGAAGPSPQKAAPQPEAGLVLLDDAALENAGLVKGFMGPVGLPQGIQVVADLSLQQLAYWLVGANKPDCHLAGAVPGRDFTVAAWADLAAAQDGDYCPECGAPIKLERGIEVGQVFQLGTKYSESMGATYMAEDGSEQPFIMGCYGWGVTRSMAAVVEQYSDAAGIAWPISVAPADVCVLPLNSGGDVESTALQLAEVLTQSGVEVVIDDRDERAGVKFADADLIGWPYQLIVGKRNLQEGHVELKERRTGERRTLLLQDACLELTEVIAANRARYY